MQNQPTPPPVVIYHGGSCLDGFGSAYAAWCHFKMSEGVEADYVAANHGDQPPDCQGRDVYIIDFSYKRPVLKQLCAQARRVIVLDHHISAQQDLAGLEQECSNLELHFDMERSGARISWDYFHRQPAPRLLELIQDRDLWRFRLPETKAVNSALMAYPLDLALWHQWADSAEAIARLTREGEAINRYRDQLIARHHSQAVMGEIAGYRVPVVNCPAAIVSELVGQLAKGYPFAAGYSDRGAVRTWSLRSTAEGLNVAEIAVRFGGGGHPRAAGFSTRIPGELLVLTVNTGERI